MKKSDRLIAIRLRNRICELKIIISCNHEWTAYGGGYKCNICDHFTGGHEQINHAIEYLDS